MSVNGTVWISTPVNLLLLLLLVSENELSIYRALILREILISFEKSLNFAVTYFNNQVEDKLLEELKVAYVADTESTLQDIVRLFFYSEKAAKFLRRRGMCYKQWSRSCSR